jgi:hypothetical protein
MQAGDHSRLHCMETLRTHGAVAKQGSASAAPHHTITCIMRFVLLANELRAEQYTVKEARQQNQTQPTFCRCRTMAQMETCG